MDSWIDNELLKTLLGNGLPPLPGNATSTGVFTTDGRACLTICDDRALPEVATEEPPMEEDKEETTEQEEESKKVDKKETETKKEDEDKQKEEKDDEPAIDGGSAEATCSLTLSAEQFMTAKSGSKKRVSCPAGCSG